MSWRNRLAERRDISKRAGGLTDKTDERAFVSFVSDPPGHSENIAAPSAPLPDLRPRLLALANKLGLDGTHVRRIAHADLALWAAVPSDALRSYLLALDDTATREAGKVPLDDTAAIYCQHCGPVWIHPDIAACLPVVAGWPRALGCPWCFVRKAGGYIPRPPAQACIADKEPTV